MAEPCPKSSETTHPAQREPALDGLRGLAILLVYLYHYGGGLQSEHIGGHAFGYLTESGWTGVVLFFVLSGFLITAGLEKSRGEPHQLRNFYLRRGLRILPLYYVSLGLAFVFALATSVRYDEMRPLLVYAAFLQNVPRYVSLAAAAPPPLPLYHFWTLAVEEQFYLLWPALLLVVHKRRAEQWSGWAERWAASGACIFVFVASAVFRIALWQGSSHASEVTRNSYAGSLPVHAGALALGAALALVPDVRRWAVRGRLAPLALLAGVATYAGVGLHTGTLDLKPALQVTLGLAAVSVSAAALVVLALRSTPVQRLLSFTPLVWLGRLSYGIYVFHILLEPLFDNIGEHFAHLQYGPGYQAVRFAVALPLSIAAAALSFAFLETPFLDLKHYFPLGAQSGDSGVPAPVS